MIEDRLVVAVLRLGHALADKSPQDRIQQSGQFWTSQQSRGLDGLRHDSMIRYAGLAKLKKSNGQQGVNDAVAPPDRSIDEYIDPGLQPPMAA